jgi:hypothetical protein
LSRLYDALSNHTLALFIGADLPQAVTGVPSRSELAHWMAEQRGLDSGLSLAQVTRRLSSQGNRYDFTALLRQGLDTTGKAPQLFHQHLVRLVQNYRIETVITTAYDALLETALRAAQVAFNRIVTTGDVGFVRPDRPTLIYLYGLAERPETIVVTEDDHYTLERDRDKEGVLDEVRNAFSHNLVLFLGYNLADPDFRLLWHDMLGRMGRTPVGAFATATGLPADELQLWAERQVTVVDVEAGAFLASLLGEAAHDGAARASTPPAATAPIPASPGEPAPVALPLTTPHVTEMAQRRARLLKERETQRRLLDILNEQRSYYTAATAPAPLVLQIQDTERAIERIEQELATLEG